MNARTSGDTNCGTARWLMTAICAALVAACGGSGDDSSLAPPSDLAVIYGSKSYTFTWPAVAGATHYRLLEDPDGAGPAAEAVVADAIEGTQYTHSLVSQLLHERAQARYRVRVCNDAGCSAPGAAVAPDVIQAVGRLVIDPQAWQREGSAERVLLSADGSTLLLKTPQPGIDTLRMAELTPTFQLFERSADGWVQRAYVGTAPAQLLRGLDGARLGDMALSADGQTVAIAILPRPRLVPNPDAEEAHGLIYLYARDAQGQWTQQTVLAGRPDHALYGQKLALSADGDVLAVAGGGSSQSAAAKFDPVHVFVRSGDAWAEQADLVATNRLGAAASIDHLALASDGQTVAAAVGDRFGVIHTGPATSAVNVFTHDASTGWSAGVHMAPAAGDNGAALEVDYQALFFAQDDHTLVIDAAGPANCAGAATAEPSGLTYFFGRENNAWQRTDCLMRELLWDLTPDLRSQLRDSQRYHKSLGLSEDGSVLYGAGTTHYAIGPHTGPAHRADWVVAFTRDADGGWQSRPQIVYPLTPPEYGLNFNDWALSADGSTLAAIRVDFRSGWPEQADVLLY